MKTDRLRTFSAVIAGLLALGLAGLLLSAQWGLAAEYGYGDGTELYAFALLPLLAGVVAVSLAGWGRRTGLALLVLTVLTVAGLPVAGAAGQRAKEARSEHADARFACDGVSAGMPGGVAAGACSSPGGRSSPTDSRSGSVRTA